MRWQMRSRQRSKRATHVIVLAARSVKLVRKYCSLAALTMMLFQVGGARGVLAAETHQPSAAFNAKVEIDIEDGEIEVMSSFTLGAGSNGLDLAKETVGLQLSGGSEAYSVTLPAGSFKKDRSGEFKFQGTINGVKMITAIRPLRAGTYEFEVETEGANLKGFSNPVTLTLIIGDDGGSRTMKAEIE